MTRLLVRFVECLTPRELRKAAELARRHRDLELGLADALSKDVLLLTRTMDDVPFDLKARRCIVYEFTPRGMQNLEQRLKEGIESIVRSQ